MTRHSRGRTSAYTPRPDGGNCEALPFPPFTFKHVRWSKGTLEVDGYAGGRKVATQTVRTAGEPSGLAISYFESGKRACKNDLLIVYVTLQDKDKRPCHQNSIKVRLNAEGGNVMGPEETETEDGVASFIVQTGNARTLRLHATCGPWSKRHRTKRLQQTS